MEPKHVNADNEKKAHLLISVYQVPGSIPSACVSYIIPQQLMEQGILTLDKGIKGQEFITSTRSDSNK